jgi:hypothetical protein
MFEGERLLKIPEVKWQVEVLTLDDKGDINIEYAATPPALNKMQLKSAETFFEYLKKEATDEDLKAVHIDKEEYQNYYPTKETHVQYPSRSH